MNLYGYVETVGKPSSFNTNLYAYTGDDPINGIDPYGLWTIQVGWSFSWQILDWSAQWGVGVAFDGHGNLGVCKYGGGGAGLGSNFGGGVSFEGSNASTICDLGKQFAHQSVTLGDVVDGSVDSFEGAQSNGQPILGGGFTAGFGEGRGATDTVTYTVVTPMDRL